MCHTDKTTIKTCIQDLTVATSRLRPYLLKAYWSETNTLKLKKSWNSSVEKHISAYSTALENCFFFHSYICIHNGLNWSSTLYPVLGSRVIKQACLFPGWMSEKPTKPCFHSFTFLLAGQVFLFLWCFRCMCSMFLVVTQSNQLPA